MFLRCGRRPSGWAVSWPDSLQLGVGRYGESVPLLLISRSSPPASTPLASVTACSTRDAAELAGTQSRGSTLIGAGCVGSGLSRGVVSWSRLGCLRDSLQTI